MPESLQCAARELAAQEPVSLDQLIVCAPSKKIAALKTLEWLRERGQDADEADLAAVLALVPGVEPEAHDRLPTSQ